MTTDRLGQLLQLQRQILMHQSTLVRPGGRLIYATCSILPQENEEQVAGFLENHPAWRCTAQQHVLPHQSNSDGFFAARLERHS
jgi:16S rRNA (cytosine967-C5)-methyltransferase